ncbi:hypothetical protein PQR62_11725 [Herbaspirillum lusitanum]|uniref:Uncharacterized protein n=1 Tax=Herbaspirillum lusitanum TaxID=213312 RepID=A0ABW9A7W3_9BURK
MPALLRHPLRRSKATLDVPFTLRTLASSPAFASLFDRYQAGHQPSASLHVGKMENHISRKNQVGRKYPGGASGDRYYDKPVFLRIRIRCFRQHAISRFSLNIGDIAR